MLSGCWILSSVTSIGISFCKILVDAWPLQGVQRLALSGESKVELFIDWILFIGLLLTVAFVYINCSL